VPLNYVTSLYGDGGVGKSLLAQQLGYAGACGGKFLGFDVPKVRVLAAFCEDGRDEIHLRHQDILNGQDAAQFANFFVWIRVGLDNLLVTFTHDGRATMSPFFKRLAAKIEELKIELLILDTAADLFGGNEIVRMQVNFFIKAVCGSLIRQANEAGRDLTILILAHPSASGAATKQGTSGSTAWNAAVRARLYLDRVEGGLPEQRTLKLMKANYAEADKEISLMWSQGKFVPTNTDESFTRSNRIRDAKDTMARLVEEAFERGDAFTAKREHPKFLDAAMVEDLGRRGYDKAHWRS
jgi:RecA-family ATPase